MSRTAVLFTAACLAAFGHVQRSEAVAWRRPYHCFFEPGSSDLSGRCKAIIAEAVASWHREREGRQPASDNLSEGLAPAYTARFEVRGYAQDAGGPAANDRLSVRRALAVAAELRALGIPDDLVALVGLGDADPLVPGAPMDPQNRRAQVVLR